MKIHEFSLKVSFVHLYTCVSFKREIVDGSILKSLNFYSFLQHVLDPIVLVNSKKQIVCWNVGAVQLFGYEEKEMIGQPIDVVFLDQINWESRAAELQARHKNGRVLPLHLSLSKWQQEKDTFFILILQDQTLNKAYESEWIQSLKQARKMEEVKGFFLAVMSHECRNSLNTIMGFTESLLMGMNGSFNPDQENALQRIRKAALNLLYLINEILDLAKLESMHWEIKSSQVDLIKLAEDCVKEMEILAQKKGLALTFTYTTSSLELSIQPMWIRQAILNLLSNAIKFTEKGSIKLTIEVTENEVEIKVIDTGIGLTSQEMEKIFEPFQQGNSISIQGKIGTGLGLAICQKIVLLHQGSLTVESEKGMGSAFTIRLPISKFMKGD